MKYVNYIKLFSACLTIFGSSYILSMGYDYPLAEWEQRLIAIPAEQEASRKELACEIDGRIDKELRKKGLGKYATTYRPLKPITFKLSSPLVMLLAISVFWRIIQVVAAP